MSDLKLTLYPAAAYSFKNHRLLSIAAYAGLEVDLPEGFDVYRHGKEQAYLVKVSATTFRSGPLRPLLPSLKLETYVGGQEVQRLT